MDVLIAQLVTTTQVRTIATEAVTIQAVIHTPAKELHLVVMVTHIHVKTTITTAAVTVLGAATAGHVQEHITHQEIVVHSIMTTGLVATMDVIQITMIIATSIVLVCITPETIAHHLIQEAVDHTLAVHGTTTEVLVTYLETVATTPIQTVVETHQDVLGHTLKIGKIKKPLDHTVQGVFYFKFITSPRIHS
ncbi:MAG: hypothetical protein JWP09_765 [Candidatus Taylorbacteria bacterium]|nr:hypothetical protein [Candidatus Taylorbacteria bacterium]